MSTPEAPECIDLPYTATAEAARRVARIEHGRVYEVATPRREMPLPRERLAVAFTFVPMGDGRVQMFDPQGAACGIFANAGLATSTLNLLNR